QDRVEDVRIEVQPSQLAPPHAAARVLADRVDAHEPEEHLAAGRLRGGIEPRVQLLGAPAERTDDAAGGAIALEGEQVARARGEELREGVLEERKRAWLVVHVRDD